MEQQIKIWINRSKVRSTGTSIVTVTRTGVSLGERKVFCQGPGIVLEENKRKILK